MSFFSGPIPIADILEDSLAPDGSEYANAENIILHQLQNFQGRARLTLNEDGTIAVEQVELEPEEVRRNLAERNGIQEENEKPSEPVNRRPNPSLVFDPATGESRINNPRDNYRSYLSESESFCSCRAG